VQAPITGLKKVIDLCAAPRVYAQNTHNGTRPDTVQVKKMLTVSELSKVAQATPDSIRHYVRIGLLKPTRNPDNGYKLFSSNDVKKVKFIRRAKGLGFTLHDIQVIFDHSNSGRSPCPLVRKIIQQRINENRDRLVELNKLQQRMDEALEKWKSMPDGEPDGDAICYLIESTT